MNIPLNWLSEYVELPKSVAQLTDRLTMVGHMLNKSWQTPDGETVIDLELRGNRSDLFSVLGVAREVSVLWNHKLKKPPVESLPIVDPESTLVKVEAKDLVLRFLAFKLQVKVGPSPDWLVSRLRDYGIASINNVVDITNYVMVETGEPMHAYDLTKIKGGRLILRRAKTGENFTTLMGTNISLTNQDLAICDQKSVVGLTMIGGQNSGVDENTVEIILEAAVYNQANVRRTARRLAIFTEAGTRHEKLLDPNEVELALSRALHLLIKHAGAVLSGKSCDYYPKVIKPVTIKLDHTEVERLTGTTVSLTEQQLILESLGCKVSNQKKFFDVQVPTFRTDIDQSADLVEEVIRIYGYEKIQPVPLSGSLPSIQTSLEIKFADKVRRLLVESGLNEVITSPFVKTNNNSIKIINAPDPDLASLRTSLTPSLVNYVKKSLGYRIEKVALFEIGKIYETPSQERVMLGLCLSGQTDNRSWNREPRKLEIYDLLGILDSLAQNLGLEFQISQSGDIFSGTVKLGIINGQEEIYSAMIDLTKLNKIVKPVRNNLLAPVFPPIIEDFSFSVNSKINIRELLGNLKLVSKLIMTADLIDSFESNRTVRVKYSSEKKTLSQIEISPIREKIIKLLTEKYSAKLR